MLNRRGLLAAAPLAAAAAVAPAAAAPQEIVIKPVHVELDRVRHQYVVDRAKPVYHPDGSVSISVGVVYATRDQARILGLEP